MFDKRRAVLSAAGVGYLLSGFLAILTVASALAAARRDPHRLVGQWQQLVTEPGHSGAGILGGLLLFGVTLAGLFFGLALAVRAARLHPTSAALGGLFLIIALVPLAAMAVWTGGVAPYAALQYQWTQDPEIRQALRLEAQWGEHLVQLGLWCFLGFAAPGLFFLGRSLRGERGWLPDALKLSAALILLHLPVSLYLARESLLGGRYVSGLAVLDHLLLWGSLAASCYLAARWLRAVGRVLPE